MNFNRTIPAGILAFAFLLIALPASASVLDNSFTRTEFNALNGTRTDINFDSFGYAPNQYSLHNTAAGLTTGGVTFIGQENSGYHLVLSNPPAGPDDFGSGTRLRGPDLFPNSFLLMMLPAQVTAFGVDLASVAPGAANFRIELDGIDLGIIIPTQLNPNRTFVGVLTDTAFSQVKIYVASGTPFSTHGLFDNFAYIVNGSAQGGGDPGVTENPEVATMVAVGSGLFFLGWKRRRLFASV